MTARTTTLLRRRSYPALLATVTAFAGVMLTACTQTPRPSTPLPTQHAASPTPQITGDLLANVSVTPAEVGVATAGGDALSVAVLQQLELSDPNGNFVDSGLSLATVLAMLQLGARGDTQAQIASVLQASGITAAEEAAAWKQLDAQLLSTATADGITLDTANAVWLQQGLPVLPAFLDTLATNFAAPSSQLDFAGNPSSAANTINQWVSDATHGMIPSIVSPGDLANCLMALADAMYFDAQWKYQFILNDTSNGPFFRADGSQVSTPLMHNEDLWSLPTYISTGLTAVELPYVGGHFAADVLMPTGQSIADFVAGLSGSSLTGLLQQLATTDYVQLTMPRFTVSSQPQLANILETLGMTDTFGAGADFSGIDGRTDIHIGLVKQVAHMHVDEVGTTATAATVAVGLGGALGGSPPPIKTVVINHPFLFVIRDVTTGAILFTAQVTDPSETS